MIHIKSLKLIYNDNAGSRNFKYELDNIIKIFTEVGYDISILRTQTLKDINNNLNNKKPDQYHTIVAAGGDGTLNTVISSVLRNNLNAKIGIIPAGTANDFARALKIEKPYTSAAEIIANGKTTTVDVGIANDQYFINVFGAGAITNISHHVDSQMKNTLGNVAYYIKALEKLQTLSPTPVKIKTSSKTIEEEIYFFLALNSCGAGGFDAIAKNAQIDDGLLDMIAIKQGTIAEMVALIMKFLKGDHLSDEKVIHYQDNYTEISFTDNVETNIDGEKGPATPVIIGTIPKAIEIFTI